MEASLVKRLAAVRKTRGLSQSGLAKLADVSRTAISQYESGVREPTGSNLLKLAGALMEDPWYLMDMEPLSKAERKRLPYDVEEALFELLAGGLTVPELRVVCVLFRQLRDKL